MKNSTPSSETKTPAFTDIYNSLKTAVAAGQAEESSIQKQIDGLQAQLTQTRENNRRAQAGLDAMGGAAATAAKAKPGPKPKAKVQAAAPTTKAKPGPKAKVQAAAAAAAPKAKPATAPVVKAKPGPKPKVQAAAKAAPVVKAKPGPKPKAKVQAAAKTTPKKGAVPNATTGRRAVASGERPVLKDAIAQVIGSGTMDAGQVVQGLTDRNWLPQAGNPRQYVSFMLSSTSDLFERVGRGLYKVRTDAPVKKERTKAKAAPAAAPAPTKKSTTTDAELAQLGIPTAGNVAPNPFAAQAQA